MAVAEQKYTDRDVRENPDLENVVTEYLEQYEGEFQYLIDCKMKLAMGHQLTVAAVRGVLNCMRNDPRIVDLPDPLPATTTVINFRPGKGSRGSRHPYRNSEQCVLPNGHGSHRLLDGNYCYGKYSINRYERTQLDAVPKPDVNWCISKSGNKIHLIDHMFFDWEPASAHEWGFKQPILKIKSFCTRPSWINNGYLLRQENLDQILGTVKPTTVGEPKQYEMCCYCECIQEES